MEGFLKECLICKESGNVPVVHVKRTYGAFPDALITLERFICHVCFNRIFRLDYSYDEIQRMNRSE